MKFTFQLNGEPWLKFNPAAFAVISLYEEFPTVCLNNEKWSTYWDNSSLFKSALIHKINTKAPDVIFNPLQYVFPYLFILQILGIIFIYSC